MSAARLLRRDSTRCFCPGKFKGRVAIRPVCHPATSHRIAPLVHCFRRSLMYRNTLLARAAPFRAVFTHPNGIILALILAATTLYFDRRRVRIGTAALAAVPYLWRCVSSMTKALFSKGIRLALATSKAGQAQYRTTDYQPNSHCDAPL